MTRKVKTDAIILSDKEREVALNTHRVHGMVLFKLFCLPATDKSTNVQIDFTKFGYLFFCSFTDIILNSYIDKKERII